MLTTQETEEAPKKPFILFRPMIAVWRWMFPASVAEKDRQSRWARSAAVAFIVAAFAGIVIFSALNLKQWRTSYKTWKSNRYLKESRELEDSDKLNEAVVQANQAYLESPENPEAIRTLARFATMMRRNEARFLWTKLRQTNAFNDSDAEWEIQALSFLNEDKTVIYEIEKLLKDRKPTRKILNVADQIMTKAGRQDQFFELARTYLKDNPEDNEVRFLLAVREMDLGSQEEKRHGLYEMWDLAKNPEEIGLKAIEILNKLTFQSKDDQAKLIQLLDEHPRASEEHKIAALKRRVALYPEQKDQIIHKAIADRKNKSNADLVPLARWLTQEEKSDLLLKVISEDAAISYPPLLENYLNALTLLERYDDLKRIIRDPKTRLTTAEREFHKAHLAFVTKAKPEEIEKALKDALLQAQAENKPLLLMNVGKYAEERGLSEIAESCYQAVSRMPQSRVGGMERQAFDSLMRLSYNNGNSKNFMQAASETSRRWPDNQSFAEKALYSSLLAGFDMEGSVNKAKQLLDSNPEDSQRKLIVALAYYRQLDPKEAVKHLQHIHLGDITVGQGAVLCGIMHLAGYLPQAESIARQIPSTYKMLPEERRFLNLVKNQMRE